MGVFDRFSEKKTEEVEVYPETHDFGEGVVSVSCLHMTHLCDTPARYGVSIGGRSISC
jgi:hypothetical protein